MAFQLLAERHTLQTTPGILRLYEINLRPIQIISANIRSIFQDAYLATLPIVSRLYYTLRFSLNFDLPSEWLFEHQ